MKTKQERKDDALQEYVKAIPRNSYVLEVVKEIWEYDKDPTFEKIVNACFKKYPEVFCLKGFSEYPDSNKIANDLFSLSQSKRLWGNMVSGWHPI